MYTNVNPVNYSVPTGTCISGAVVDIIFCIFVISMVVGAVVNATNNVVSHYHDSGHLDWDEVVGHT